MSVHNVNAVLTNSRQETKGNMSHIETVDVKDLIAAEKYPHNKIFNLDPENVLPRQLRDALRLEIEPELTEIRAEINKQKNRISVAFNSARRSFKMQYPADDLDYLNSDYHELVGWTEELFIQTLDFEDLIEKGAPFVFIASGLRNLRENLEFIKSEIGKALKRLAWRELEKSAIEHRNWRLPPQERKG